jgi:hypothetical protein
MVAIGLILLGGGTVGFGVKLLVDGRRFMADALAADGVVVRVDESVRRERRGPSDDPYYVDVTHRTPVIQFRTAREQMVQFNGDDGSLRVGDAVRVLYEPANPKHARLNNLGTRVSGAAIGVILTGLALIAINMVIYRLAWRWRRIARWKR